MHRRRRLLTLVIVTAGCASSQVAETVTTPPVTPTAPSTVAITTSSASVQPSESSVARRPDPTGRDPSASVTAESTTPSTTVGVASTNAPADGCRLIADLDDTAEIVRWQIVNDGVMGGRSRADATVNDSTLVFSGEIVTDGGGFSSVRLALDAPLGEVSRLLLRVRTDGRPYELTAADAAPGRDRRVSHQAAIASAGSGAWEEVAVELDELEASIFGRSVTVDPFVPTAAVEVGIILADGTDGPFRFELDWIKACP